MRRIADQCEQEPSRENVAAAIHAAREMRAKSLLDAALLIAGAVGTRDDLYPAVPNADGFRNFADILSLVQDSIVAVVKAAIIAAEGDNKVLGEFVEDIVEILSEMNEQPRVSLLR